MPEINYEEWKQKLKEFKLYFEGLVKHSTTPLKRLITLYSELEEMVFGETKTKSWA